MSERMWIATLSMAAIIVFLGNSLGIERYKISLAMFIFAEVMLVASWAWKTARRNPAEACEREARR